jgi:hypothetical protein
MGSFRVIGGFIDADAYDPPERIGEGNNFFCDLIPSVVANSASGMPRIGRASRLAWQVRLEFKFGTLGDLIGAQLLNVGRRDRVKGFTQQAHRIYSPLLPLIWHKGRKHHLHGVAIFLVVEHVPRLSNRFCSGGKEKTVRASRFI